jgi:hypothetical protein
MFRPQPSGTLFTFELEGKTYEIAGYVDESGESANYLTHRERDNVVFRAIDRNRVGIIDQVVSGSISTQEANEIYQAGIQIAMERDLFKNIDKDRAFEFRHGDYQLMVESYQKRAGQFHNRFVLFDVNWKLKGIYWDDNSDGIIDRADSGDLDMDRVQELYSIAIQRAGEENRLDERDDGQLIIRTNKKRQNGLAGVTY